MEKILQGSGWNRICGQMAPPLKSMEILVTELLGAVGREKKSLSFYRFGFFFPFLTNLTYL